MITSLTFFDLSSIVPVSAGESTKPTGTGTIQGEDGSMSTRRGGIRESTIETNTVTR
ncbi:MAG: hypothetical protein LZF62_420059 [Nitrospira sp.]|nr:MAG: hypothetical protein LZF62_420059 [Nitrospira sp.]